MTAKLHLPTSLPLAAAVADEGRIRAGGTDLMERRHKGLAPGDVVDLRDVPGLAAIEEVEGGLRIGARVTVAAIADSALVRGKNPALAKAAASLATPQIRAVATLGGNLLQQVRCWYARNPDFAPCLKRGGFVCHARDGDHLFHGCYDVSPCIAPAPSSLGLAMLVHDATIEAATADGPVTRTADALYDVLETPSQVHALPKGAVLTHVMVPTPPMSELGGYLRTIHRSRSEWPLVEASVRLRTKGGTITFAAVGIGGVAPRPFRQPRVEEALVGQPLAPETLAKAADKAGLDAPLLPGSAYKRPLIAPTVLGALQGAVDEGVR